MNTPHFPKTEEALDFLISQVDASFVIAKTGDCLNPEFVREQVTMSRRAITTGKRADPDVAVTNALANIAFMMRSYMSSTRREGHAVERLVIFAASSLRESGTQLVSLPHDHRTFILREIDTLDMLAGEVPDGHRWASFRDLYNDATPLPSVEEAIDVAIATVVRMHGDYIRYNADFNGFRGKHSDLLSAYSRLSSAMRTLSGALR